MGPFSITTLIAGGALLGTVVIDVTVNVMQDWYQTVYTDAFWSHRVSDTPAMRDLSNEEAQINELLRSSSDFSTQQIVIPERRTASRVQP